jgi:mono/diheme cytochrome c family protein
MRSPPAAAMVMTVALVIAPGLKGGDGPGLYAALCAACHGHGATPLAPYPALFGNANLTHGGPLYVALKTLQGAGNMFPLCAVATDDEVASLANYLAEVNTSPMPPMSVEVAAELRPAAGDCPPVRR